MADHDPGILVADDLFQLVKGPIRAAVERGAIAASPEAAMERLSGLYGSEKELLETPVARQVAKALDSGLLLFPLLAAHPERLLMTAPHTHWDPECPIVVVHDPAGNCLFIGAHDVAADARFFPVSFVFLDGQPVPYEFLSLDGSQIDPAIIAGLRTLAESLTGILDTPRDGFGFSFDYRSAVLQGSVSQRTVETEFNDRLGVIHASDRHESLYGATSLAETVSVAWPALSCRRIESLSDSETRILEEIRTMLAGCATEADRVALTEDILQVLNA